MSHVPDDDQSFDLDACENILQYHFSDSDLLENCLTHASIAKTRLASNERLEFLGDSILGVVVCEYLYQEFPECSEGELTRIKSAVVSRNCCARMVQELGLEPFIRLGRGFDNVRELPESILAGVFESVIAGIYLDGGLEPVRNFLTRVLKTEVIKVAERNHQRNYKSLLQQFSQKEYGETPVYTLLDEKGPDHSKCFKVSARIGDQRYTPAWGNNKKEAEQKAATNAFYELEGKDVPFETE